MERNSARAIRPASISPQKTVGRRVQNSPHTCQFSTIPVPAECWPAIRQGPGHLDSQSQDGFRCTPHCGGVRPPVPVAHSGSAYSGPGTDSMHSSTSAAISRVPPIFRPDSDSNSRCVTTTTSTVPPALAMSRTVSKTSRSEPVQKCAGSTLQTSLCLIDCGV